MASKRKIQEAVNSTAEEEPVPKKTANTEEDALPKDNTDGPTPKATQSIKKGFESLFLPINAEEQVLGQLTNEPDIAKDEPDGSPLPKYDLKKFTYLPPVFIFTNFKGRGGSVKDARDMANLFDGVLNFPIASINQDNDLPVFADLTGQQFKHEIKQISQYNYSLWGGVVVVVMTHGKQGGKMLFHGEDGCEYESAIDIQKDLLEPFFGNSTLVGKPKVFILTSCRGSSHHAGMEVDQPDGPGNTTLPKNADVIVAYSTSEGQVAVRDNTHGSWYIEEFVEVVKKHHKKCHLVELLTEVQRLVAEKTSQTNGVTKNMPEFVSNLRKQLFMVYK